MICFSYRSVGHRRYGNHNESSSGPKGIRFPAFLNTNRNEKNLHKLVQPEKLAREKMNMRKINCEGQTVFIGKESKEFPEKREKQKELQFHLKTAYLFRPPNCNALMPFYIFIYLLYSTLLYHIISSYAHGTDILKL